MTDRRRRGTMAASIQDFMTRILPFRFLFLLCLLLASANPSVLAQRDATSPRASPETSGPDNQAPTGEPAIVARGRIVYRDRCRICHFSDSEAKKMGPGLKGLFQREKPVNARKVTDAAFELRVEQWIRDGGPNMPPFKGVLNAAQFRDLIAYLKTL